MIAPDQSLNYAGLRKAVWSSPDEPDRPRFLRTGKRGSHAAPNSCDPEKAMKIFFCILAVLVIAASLFADYKWRQWMAARRRERP
jgi:hypothetical protein